MRIAVILFIICLSLPAQAYSVESHSFPYSGSSSCRECHEKFYQLWSTSMQFLSSFKEFPPSQKAGSFSIDKVMETLSTPPPGHD